MLTLVVFLVAVGSRTASAGSAIELDADGVMGFNLSQPAIVEVPSNARSILHVAGIPSWASYVIFQLHTQMRNLTLSFHNVVQMNTAVTGRNIGTVTLLQAGQSDVQLFLFSHQNITVRALVYIRALSEQDPLPGGCNLEFNLENDPNFIFTYSTYLAQLRFQWANVGFPRQSLPPDCDSSNSFLKYDLYVLFLQEATYSETDYFTAVQSMLTANSTIQKARKVKSLLNFDKEKSSVVISSYPGQGVVYNVVVTQTRGKMTTMASYIPMVTYACDREADPRSCHHFRDAVTLILLTIAGAFGLFLCFVGHRFFKTEMFIFGFSVIGLLIYIVLMAKCSLTFGELIGITFLFGAVGGCVWLGFWCVFGIPVLSVLLAGLAAGYISSCVLFFTPFANLKYWQTNLNYGITFTSASMLLPVFFLAYTRLLNIISCAFVGSFAVVFTIDLFIGGITKFILLNSINRVVYPEFIGALIIAPYQLNDIILTILWVILFALGTGFQVYREKDRAPFPSCPRTWQRYRVLRRHASSSSQDAGEREPLIHNQEQLRFGNQKIVIY